MFLVCFSDLRDPVTDRLCAAAQAGILPAASLLLRADRPASANVQAVLARAGDGAALVGVGLAGTLLLNLAAHVDPVAGWRMLALFPCLGVDARPYGADRPASPWSERWLRLARRPLVRRLMTSVAVTPGPRGLDGVVADRRLSWRHLAAAADRADFVGIVVPAAAAVTVVLNKASKLLDSARSEVVFQALNARLVVAAADPASADLPDRVRAWLQGGGFAQAAGGAVTARAGGGRA